MIRIERVVHHAAVGLVGATVLMSANCWAAPQIPLAAGTYKQLSLVMVAAEKCGFRSFRIDESASSYKYLYTNDDLESYPCVQAWLKKSARRIGLSPRYPNDVYQR